MREATAFEFNEVISRIPVPVDRQVMTGKRYVTVIYRDRGKEVAESTQMYSRGKPVGAKLYLVNPDYLSSKPN